MSFVRAPEVVAEELIDQSGLEERSPLFERAKRRADALGLDLNAVLKQDAERLAVFPTAECLTPPEVTAYWADEVLANQRYEHAESCEFCTNILQAARPTEQQLERFLDELGSFATRMTSSSTAVGAAQENRSKPAAVSAT